jgi:hypothetical protein
MKYLQLFFFIIITTTLLAQVPESFKYQAVIRDATGAIIKNQAVQIKFEILKDSVTGESVYQEMHSDTTNFFGFIIINIGLGTVLTGDFNNIEWGDGIYFLKMEVNLSGTYELMGISQLLSVPYALYAKNSSGWTVSTDTIFSKHSKNIGIGTSSPTEKLQVAGNIRIEDTLIFPGYSNSNFTSRGQILVGGRDIKIGYQNDNFGNILIGNSLYGKSVFDIDLTGNGNIGIGTDVFHETTSGTSNICIGIYAGYNISTGNDNIFFGQSAGEHISSAKHTICLGLQSGNGRNGEKNIFIGKNAGYSWSGGGDDNIMIGDYAGFMYNATNSNCIFIGQFSGYNTGDDNNMYFGPYETGRDATGTKNIFLGYQTGKGFNGSNFLLIDNKNDNTAPFIKGDMENDKLEINADVDVEGSLSSESINIDSVLNFKEIQELPANPAKGDMIYFNDTLRFYNGVEWKNLW